MFEKNHIIIRGSGKNDILIDVTFLKKINLKEVVIFSHGFKGFKDWGPFNKIAESFAMHGLVFVKFNFSYNGTSIDSPKDFVDLDSFGNNNFCKELDDLGLVINWVSNKFFNSKIILFGHSRGGSISILKSAEDDRVSKIVSWASPSDFIKRLPDKEKRRNWQSTNVAYVYNGRTKQNMPMYYQFYENCMTNLDRLNIKKVLKSLKIPHLHVHGSSDKSVLIDEAYQIKKWNKATFLHIIKEANHVFGSFHPYNLMSFPKDLKNAIDFTISFLKT